MCITEEQWNSLEKRIADLEMQHNGQQCRNEIKNFKIETTTKVETMLDNYRKSFLT